MLDVDALGPLIVRHDGSPVAVPGATQRMLLTLLVVHRWGPVSADVLIDGLWGRARPRNPRNALQQAIAKLRAALRPAPGPVVVTEGGGYRLERHTVRVDVERFAALVDHAGADLAGGSPAVAQRRFRDALRLWRGRPFADLPDALAAAPEIGRLDELHAVAIEGRVEADLALRGPEAVVVELRALLDADPLREHLWAHLLVALYRAGRQADALAAYREARDVLIRQVGVEPGDHLRRTHASVLAQDPALLRPATVIDDDIVAPVHDLLEAAGRAVTVLATGGGGFEHAALVLACVRALNRRPAAFAHDRWLARFDAVHEHVIAAIAWAVARPDGDTALALAVESARYWDHRQMVATARETLDDVLAVATRPSALRSEALTWLAFFTSDGGDTGAALHHLERAVDDARHVGDLTREAGAGAVASVVLRDRDPGAAQHRASAALDLFLAHGDRREIAYGWITHALAALAHNDLDSAAASARAAAVIYAELGDRRGLAWTRAAQARLAAALGRTDEAATLRAEAHAVATDLDDVRAVVALELPHGG